MNKEAIQIKEAILELYLAIKVRSSEEVSVPFVIIFIA